MGPPPTTEHELAAYIVANIRTQSLSPAGYIATMRSIYSHVLNERLLGECILAELLRASGVGEA